MMMTLNQDLLKNYYIYFLPHTIHLQLFIAAFFLHIKARFSLLIFRDRKSDDFIMSIVHLH